MEEISQDEREKIREEERRNISKKFVSSKTPTQVASNAKKILQTQECPRETQEEKKHP